MYFSSYFKQNPAIVLKKKIDRQLRLQTCFLNLPFLKFRNISNKIMDLLFHKM